MKYEQIYKNKNQFLSLTTLYPEEFEQILPIFRKCWESHYRMYTLDGKRRNSPFNNPSKETRTLATIEDKLFFILVYFKQHPLQEFQAVAFGLSQPRVSRWVKTLSLLLEDTFRRMGHTPCRQGESLAQFMKKLPMGNTATLTQDVVEQTMPRPIEDDAQKAMYSGKKKVTHTKTK